MATYKLASNLRELNQPERPGMIKRIIDWLKASKPQSDKPVERLTDDEFDERFPPI